MKTVLLTLLFLPSLLLAKDIDVSEFQPDRLVTYKTIRGVDLQLHIFNPEGHKASDRAPVIVLFFGGGWAGGSPGKLYGQCNFFASKGMVAIAADYRVKGRNKTTPVECVKDGKSAIRWVRIHADKLGIDPDKVIGGGASAGGHVAAATGTAVPFNEETDDLSVSARPNALVLFNPVFDNGPGGYGHERVSDYWKMISPMHNMDTETPPTIVFFGDNDKHVPVATAEEYKKRMEGLGHRCDLFIYNGQGHGFFNYRKGGDPVKNKYFNETLKEAGNFLASLGYLKSETKTSE